MDNSQKKFTLKLFMKDVGSVFSIKVVVYVIGFLTSIYLARTLGPAGKGKLAVIISVYSIILQFGNMGLHTAHVYYIAKDRSRAAQCEGNIIFLTVVSAVLVLAAIVYLMINGGSSGLESYSLIIALLLVPVNLFIMLQENLFIAVGQIRHYNIMELLNNGLYIAFVIGASLFLPVNAELVAAGMLAGAAVIIVYSIVVYFKYIEKSVKLSLRFLKEILPYGMKSYLACLATYLVLKIDVLMIKYFLDEYEVGIYSLATSLVELTFMVSSSIALLLFPRLGSLSRFEEKKKMLKQVYIATIPVMLAIYLAMGIGIRYVIVILYGTQYIDAIGIIRMLLPGAFFWSSSQYIFNFLATENKFLSSIIVPVITLILNIATNYYLIPVMGIMGAAAASTISYGVCFAGMLASLIFYIKRKEKKG